MIKNTFLRSISLLVFFFLAKANAQNAPATFFVTTDLRSGGNEMLFVTASPFDYSAVEIPDGNGKIIASPGDLTMSYSPDGVLYGNLGDQLVTIEPTTAVTQPVAAVTGETSSPVALAFDSYGDLYTSDGYSLYSVNPDSGTSTKINPFHTNSVTSKLTTSVFSLAIAPDGSMYGADDELYTIDPETAAATPIGPIAISPEFIRAKSLAFGGDGNLYMLGTDNSLYLLNTNNAAAQLLGVLPGTSYGLVNSINPAAPAFLTEPQSITITPSNRVVLSVTATGNPKPKATWFYNGSPYPFGTNFSLTLTNVSAADNGSYFVVLTNSVGSVTSDVVTVTVTNQYTPTNFYFLATSATTGLYADSILSLSTNPITENVLGGFSTSMLSIDFDTNGDLYGTDGQFLYRIDTNTWGLAPVGPFLYGGNGLGVTGIAYSASNVLYCVAPDGIYTALVTNQTAVATKFATFPSEVNMSAIAFGPKNTLYGGEDILYQINYTNAAITRIAPIIGLGGTTFIGGDMKVGSDGYLYFNENSSVYRMNPLTAHNVAIASYQSTLTGLAFLPAPFDESPPTIVSAEDNQILPVGGSVTIAVMTGGAGPQTFEWLQNGTRIQDGSRYFGTTTSTFVISNIMTSDAGRYTLVVSNQFGFTGNVVANLTVGAGPSISGQPAPTVRVTEGNLLNLSVTAKGATPLSYQWYVGDTAIAGATSAKLRVQASPLNGVSNLFYRVQVNNYYGSAVSAPSDVTVLRSTAKPTVAITTPALRARTNSPIISGTTSADAVQVWYWVTNINAGVTSVIGPITATQTSTTKWSDSPAVLPGTNIIAAQSLNEAGNVSAIATRSFFYIVPSPLGLATYGGSGTFTGKASVAGDIVPTNGAGLNIGEGYSVTAKAAPGNLFAYWADGTNNTTSATLNFIMEDGLSLTANFVTNEFFGLTGTYDGLFPNNNPVTEASAGIITGLKLGTNGSYSGTLTLQGVNHSFSGAFNAASLTATNTIARAGGAIVLNLTVLTDYPSQIIGTVSSTGWESDLHMIARLPGSQPSAAYTMLLPPPTDTSFGFGYAAITNKAGSVTFSGSLPDGATFTPSPYLNEDETVPFYASLYGNKGLLTGWLNFDTGEYGDAVPVGQLIWVQANGVTNAITVQGSTWSAPAANSAALPFTGTMILDAGNLGNELQLTIVDSTKNALTAIASSASGDTLAGAVNAKTGVITFTVHSSTASATATGVGVYLQNPGTGGGYIKGDGAFTLNPAQ